MLLVTSIACGNDDATGEGSGSDEGDATSASSSATAGTTAGTTATSTAGTTAGTGSGASTGSDETAGTDGDDTAGTGDPCDCAVGAYVPVCGIDGMTYDAACGIECVPVDVACNGECPCPAFMCGEEVCAPGEVVCTTVVPGVPDAEPTHTCGTLPPSCAELPAPDCTCFVDNGAACDCMQDPDGYFRIMCYGA